MTSCSKNRIIGCLLGGAIGDAIGSKYEGEEPPRVVSWDPPWRISDDTQLTMATCEALIEDGHATPEGIGSSFLRWFKERKLTGLGAATRGALSALEQGGHWALVGRRGEMAAGNGAAMRVAPLAFVLDPTSDEGRLMIRDISRITHQCLLQPSGLNIERFLDWPVAKRLESLASGVLKFSSHTN